MSWSDLFRDAKDALRGAGGWFRKQEPEPPPRYREKEPVRLYPGPPPVPPDYRSGPPPVQPGYQQQPQFDTALHERILETARRAGDPFRSDDAAYADMQQLLQEAIQLRSQPIYSAPAAASLRVELEQTIQSIQKWIRDFEQGQVVHSPSYPIADVQNWPDEYREEITPEAVVTKTPGSSNVYSFVWVSDEHTIEEDGGISVNLYGQRSSEMGTLIVTFKDWAPGMKQKERPVSPGATYAYAGVSRFKYEAFLGSTSPDSAGYAVWDYLRIRGTQSGHQHAYRLISVTGEYVPRIATPYGFRRRQQKGLVVATPEERQAEDDLTPWIKTTLRSTLPPGPLTRFGAALPNEQPRGVQGTEWSRVSYARRGNRGYPNRGQPNRGTPNSGQP